MLAKITRLQHISENDIKQTNTFFNTFLNVFYLISSTIPTIYVPIRVIGHEMLNNTLHRTYAINCYFLCAVETINFLRFFPYHGVLIHGLIFETWHNVALRSFRWSRQRNSELSDVCHSYCTHSKVYLSRRFQWWCTLRIWNRPTLGDHSIAHNRWPLVHNSEKNFVLSVHT